MKAFLKAAAEKIAPKPFYEYQLFMKRNWEPELALLPELCNKEKISIDVGANIGLYSKNMLPHSAKVIAFEPLPVMQKRLKTHFGNRLDVFGVALSDEDGTADIRLPVGMASWATIDPNNTLSLSTDAPLETIVIETRRLDSYGLNNIGFIKIDVEGHEEGVLRGGADTIARNRPTVLVEVEERHNVGSVDRVRAFFEERGYAGFFSSEGALHPIGSLDLARDQDIQNVGTSGKTGRYINNFIFRPL